MASNQKKVEVKVETESDLSGVTPLEVKIEELRKQRIQIGIDIAQEKLKDTQAEIEKLKQEKANLEVGVDDSKIHEIDMKIMELDQKSLDLQMSVETGELQKAKAEVEELDGKEVELNLAVQNFSQGISQAKQGVSELASNMNEVAQAGMQSEQNKAFLEMNLGADKAKQTYQDISDIVASMPGDDNTMRSVLSTAQALGNNLNHEEMKAATSTMADYMSGSATMGKQAVESQQDIMKYLLDGNTAELERGSIVSAHVDKLKDINTFQERQAAMQQVLNELGYGGIASQDTMLNKQAEWEGMLYNSQDALSSMWLGAEKGAMDYIIKLNDVTGGLAGMGIVAGQMVAGPFVDILGGLSQIRMGFETLKKAADFTGITGKLKGLKDALTGVGGKAKEALVNMGNLGKSLGSTVLTNVKNAATAFLNLGKQVWSAGLNALKSAGLWVIHKAQMAASTIATWAQTAAQWALNSSILANPITWLVIAIVALIAVLGYLYFNNEQVRAAIDGLGQSLMMFGQWVYNGAIYWLQQLQTTLMNLWNYIVTLGGLLPANVQITGNSIIDTILRVLLFIATLPIQLGMIFVNILARALGFGNNFAQRMINGAVNTVTGFINKIRQLPGMIQTEFARIEGIVSNFVTSLPQRVWDLGASIVDALKSALGIGSPGHMYYMFEGELKRLDNLPGDMQSSINRNVSLLGSGIVDSFGEHSLGLRYEDTMNHQLETNANGNTGNTGNTYNFYHYGDIDNEERMNKVLDALVRRLNFENETAGRAV